MSAWLAEITLEEWIAAAIIGVIVAGIIIGMSGKDK